jgi:hypothetical protein
MVRFYKDPFLPSSPLDIQSSLLCILLSILPLPTVLLDVISQYTQRNWNEFEKNDLIDVLDAGSHWYEALVLDVCCEKIHIHYRGFHSRWDELIPQDSCRLAPWQSKTYKKDWDDLRKASQVFFSECGPI